MFLGGVFPANRTSDSCECGRFTAKVALILSLSLSLSSQRNAQPGLTKISRSSWPTEDLWAIKMDIVRSLSVSVWFVCGILMAIHNWLLALGWEAVFERRKKEQIIPQPVKSCSFYYLGIGTNLQDENIFWEWNPRKIFSEPLWTVLPKYRQSRSLCVTVPRSWNDAGNCPILVLPMRKQEMDSVKVELAI